MKLKEVSARKLKRMTKRKKIICFGAGEMFGKTFSELADMKLEKDILFVADNDKTKWGSIREVNGKGVEIVSPEKILEEDASKCFIIITAVKYKEIYAQLQNLLRHTKVVCYVMPKHRYGIAKPLVKILKKLPLRNYILFRGEGDTCENAMALGKYIREHNYLGKYKLIWLCDNPYKFKSTTQEKYIRKSLDLAPLKLREIFQYYYYMYCSKYVFFENKMIPRCREDQINMYMHHGAPPIKATKGRIVVAKDVNYAICPTERVAYILEEHFSVNKERMIFCGSPRTDVLFEEGIHKALYEKLNLEKYKKVVLWLPTFRHFYNKVRVDSQVEYTYGIPIVSDEMDYKRLTEYLVENNILLIIKPHLYQDMSKMKIDTSEHIRFITQNDLNEVESNVYDLLKLSDALITDYSTVAFDFMLLDRMIGYTIDDMSLYNLGFSVPNPLDYMPGKKIEIMDELINYLEDVCQERDTYKEERNQMNDYINEFKGNNCERLLKKINMI